MKTPARSTLCLQFALCLLFAVSGCAGTSAATWGSDSGPTSRKVEEGMASYYTEKETSQRTASGRTFDDSEPTAAHRTLPFGTRVKVTNLANGRSVVVTITDRGPFRKGRVIDVSKAAARDLGFLREGVARVRVETLRG